MNQLATTNQPQVDEQPAETTTAMLVLNNASMESMFKLADTMAGGRATVPKHLQGNPADCLAVVMQAVQWRMNPFAVAQKTHLVGGTLGYEAQLVNAVVTAMAPTRDRLHYEWFGDWTKIVGKFKTVESKTKKDDDGHFKKYIVPDWDQKDEVGLGVRVWATMKGESEPRSLELLMTQARTRNSTLWTEDPKQQIAYLASKRWARLHCPDVILGVYTPDEFEGAEAPKNMGNAEVVGAHAEEGLPAAELAAWRAEAEKGFDAAAKHWKAMGADKRKLATQAQREEMSRIAKEADDKRTVDATEGKASKDAEPAKTADAPAADAGKVDDSFVADMERHEGQQGS